MGVAELPPLALALVLSRVVALDESGAADSRAVAAGGVLALLVSGL
jgi:hypothetical protein